MAGLKGQVALITGAGGMQGIGRATALKLATHGADVALTDVQRAPEDLPPAETWDSGAVLTAWQRRSVPWADIACPSL
jgi:NAD(P)-dependent dehydrogenase (short-subunit alcohol dehydrogenase family)